MVWHQALRRVNLLSRNLEAQHQYWVLCPAVVQFSSELNRHHTGMSWDPGTECSFFASGYVTSEFKKLTSQAFASATFAGLLYRSLMTLSTSSKL
eukprot:3852407-Rhodomonas_salina.1